jgi:hypothetical protein
VGQAVKPWEKWHDTKTLLGGEPDRNKRYLYRGDYKIMMWNDAMEPWPKWKDVLLKRIVADLNQLEGWDDPA